MLKDSCVGGGTGLGTVPRSGLPPSRNLQQLSVRSNRSVNAALTRAGVHTLCVTVFCLSGNLVRRDSKLKNVIISEKRDKKAAQFLTKLVRPQIEL